MKIMKTERVGIQQVYSTNVPKYGTYVSKGDIINKNCVVDADYEGEVHLSLINTNSHPVALSFGMKILQFIVLPVNMCTAEEKPKSELYINSKSVRGDGGFGSTGG